MTGLERVERFICGTPGAHSPAEVATVVPEIKRTTVQVYLRRLLREGLIGQSTYGLYTAPGARSLAQSALGQTEAIVVASSQPVSWKEIAALMYPVSKHAVGANLRNLVLAGRIRKISRGLYAAPEKGR